MKLFILPIPSYHVIVAGLTEPSDCHKYTNTQSHKYTDTQIHKYNAILAGLTEPSDLHKMTPFVILSLVASAFAAPQVYFIFCESHSQAGFP